MDCIDAPIGERQERYTITLTIGSIERLESVIFPHLALTPADVGAMRAHGNALSVAIAQIGELGASSMLTSTIMI